jgi:hypothetical protein
MKRSFATSSSSATSAAAASSSTTSVPNSPSLARRVSTKVASLIPSFGHHSTIPEAVLPASCASCGIIDYDDAEIERIRTRFYNNHRPLQFVPVRGTSRERYVFIHDLPEEVLTYKIFRQYFTQSFIVHTISVLCKSVRSFILLKYMVQYSITSRTIDSLPIPIDNHVPGTPWLFNALKICTKEDIEEGPLTADVVKKLKNLRLVELHVEGTPFNGHELKDCDSIRSLKVVRTSNFTRTDALPSKLEKFAIDAAYRVSDISKLPQSLLEFSSYHAKFIGDVSSLPLNIHTLNLSYCQEVTDITCLPPTVTKLDLSWCSKLTSVKGLPKTVTWLSLARIEDLTDLKDLPSNLTHLDISRNRALKDISGLPESLITLNARELYSIKEVKGLPKGLRNLSLRGCYQLQKIDLPVNLFLLDLGQCSNLADISKMLSSSKKLYSLSVAECTELHKQPNFLHNLPDSVKILMVYYHKRRDYGEAGWDLPY